MEFDSKGTIVYLSQSMVSNNQIIAINVKSQTTELVKSGLRGDLERINEHTYMLAAADGKNYYMTTATSTPVFEAPGTQWFEGEYSLLAKLPETGRKLFESENAANLYTRQVGNKRYELKDHLGNLRATISNNKHLNTDNNNYQAAIESINHYYPFGMLQPGKHINTGMYRFGFQGQEKDDEISGSTGSHINYKYRIHDTRIGRFLSIDPLTKDYPHNSPYAFSENRVIDGIELEGLEYLDADEAKINFINGVIAWDYKNVTGGTRNRINATQNQIIVQNHITIKPNMEASQTKSALSKANRAVFPQSVHGNIEVQRPLTKKSNYTQPNKSFKQRTIAAKAPKSKLWAVDALIYGVQALDYGTAWWDKRQFEKQMPFYMQAQKDFIDAAQNGHIPGYLLSDETSVSNIMNVILRGDVSNPHSFSDFTYKDESGNWVSMPGEEYEKLIKDIGMKIYNKEFDKKEETNTDGGTTQ